MKFIKIVENIKVDKLKKSINKEWIVYGEWNIW